jgi:glycosyltransferase involved in cell wall biosynthesis
MEPTLHSGRSLKGNARMNTKSPKILRLVTSSDAVLFHLKNLLNNEENTFETIIVGNNVTPLASYFPGVRFIDLNIKREVNIQSDIIALIKLFRIISAEKPDIVHSIMPKAGLIGALAGFLARVPLRIHTFTGQTWATAEGLKRRFLITMDKVVCRLNTICFTDSYSQSEFLFQNQIAYKNLPLPVIARGSLSGVDLARFNKSTIIPNRSDTRKSLGISETEFVYIFLGRKHKDKGIFELLNAFDQVKKKHPEARLVLVGPDETNGSLNDAIRSLGSEIINLPLTNTPEVFLNAGDVFCLPSYREGFGSVIIEAAALGLPAIGTRIPGLIDSIIHGKTGLLIPKKDIYELAEAMTTLIEDPGLVKSMSESARAHAEKNFDSRYVFTELKKKYYELMS